MMPVGVQPSFGPEAVQDPSVYANLELQGHLVTPESL